MANVLIGKELKFGREACELPGAARVAELVKGDIRLVTDVYPQDYRWGDAAENVVIYGVAGQSEWLAELEESKKIDLGAVRGKWEVYGFWIVEEPFPDVKNALVIAGSDKRGVIYGLFHLSELIGVSPLVNWNHVWPQKREQVILDEGCNMVSREPSVKYRGFFINDEWPAFGTWATKHFGEINAKCYEKVFELLLRLKGNYLWPAMWASNFSMDGPGLESAKLADELGVVMSTSHHEPCMRAGAEYGLLRGKDSVYGDAWSFLENEEGITRFWRDGLLRNKPFENVITMGMRGENDTAILGKNATLKDNIDLLRKVLKTQNRLIRETINEDLDKVPRQIVLFTEVEEFFYGNEQVEGLMGDPELEGVTLMLSDNNHGATRTLPTEEMRSHKGGCGMYYHMDMHGGAHSYQWIGSTYLPKLWEQMTMAYEYGVREIWVTNIGDIGTQEHGLSFFLDLAYDMDRWGGKDAAVTVKYTREWLKKQFGGVFREEELLCLETVFDDYLLLLARRKHEVMNDKVYHPVHFGEAQDVLTRCGRIFEICNVLRTQCPSEMMAAYQSLVYYPACGTANLMRMWILAGRNALYAAQNRVEANLLADELEECFALDEELTAEYHGVDGGMFEGFGLSEHIGFRSWVDEDNQYPLQIYVRPANRPRMIVARAEDENYMDGRPWSKTKQVWRDALRPDVSEIWFDIACAGRETVKFRIETDCEWMHFSRTAGEAAVTERLCLHIDRTYVKGYVTGKFFVIHEGVGKAEVTVEADSGRGLLTDAFPEADSGRGLLANTFLETDGYVCMEAAHFCSKHDVPSGGFEILSPYGRTGSAIKAFPVTKDYTREKERPCTEYRFFMREAGACVVRFYMAATTPVVYDSRQYIGFSVNSDEVTALNTVKEDRQFFLSPQWTEEAYNNCKITEAEITVEKGVNVLKFWAMSPAIVLERIVVYRKDCGLLESYLGPRESYLWSRANEEII